MKPFHTLMKVWDPVDRGIAWGERLFLIVALAGMALLVFSQVILRNVFSHGITWFDPLARHLMLSTVYVGASLATFHHHHLHIDALVKLMNERQKQVVHVLVALITVVVCAVLFYGGVQFVHASYLSGDRIESVFPSWIAQLVMPYGFFMMAMRFLKEALRETLGLPIPKEAQHP